MDWPRNIIADGEDGLLVRNGDTADLADKICQMIEHPDKRVLMGQAACRNVARFSEANIFAQYVKFYQHLINNK